MKILVTGGCGFIGSHTVDKLIELGHDVKVLDNLEEQVHQGGKPDYLNPKAEYIFDDIRDKDAVRKAIGDMDIIFHLAAAVGVGQSMYQIKKYMDVNTLGTANLLDMLVNSENSVKKLIVASSMSIYGEGSYECESCGAIYPKLRSQEQMKRMEWEMKCPKCGMVVKAMPTNEDKPLYPTSVYAISKRDQEELCLVTGQAYGIPTVALRYFNTYGPRQSLSNPYTGLCAIISSRLKNNKPPIIFEDGLQTRDFISVKDIVQANIKAMENSEADYKALNVGTGKHTSVREVIEILAKLFNKAEIKAEIVNKFRAGDIRHCYSDISRISKLGFKPRVSLEQGMKELVDWGRDIKAEDKAEQAKSELEEKGLV